jgi:hypothetical protein
MWTPAVTHQPENVGTQAFEVILVELKQKPAASKSVQKPTTATPTNNN